MRPLKGHRRDDATGAVWFHKTLAPAPSDAERIVEAALFSAFA